MSMDVVGRRPDSPVGEYFGASCWAWRPIHALMAELCSDFLDEELLHYMFFNDGAGPENQEICTQIADCFAKWTEHNVTGYTLAIRVTREWRIVSEEEIKQNPELETWSPWQVQDDHLKEWIEFLRHCGGFAVN